MSYRRAAEDRRRLIRLAGETESRWGCGAYFCNRKGRYIRYYRSNANGASQHHRRQSNRRVRRNYDLTMEQVIDGIADHEEWKRGHHSPREAATAALAASPYKGVAENREEKSPVVVQESPNDE